jgi:hypothetical protein
MNEDFLYYDYTKLANANIGIYFKSLVISTSFSQAITYRVGLN